MIRRAAALLFRACLLALVLAALLPVAYATETEHFGLQILPAPGKVVVDGKLADWDLAGSIFACGDVEHNRDKFGVWLAAMYDADNLYLAAHWMDDTPLNNAGVTTGDFGWSGDCVQFRVIADYGQAGEQVNVFNCWRGADGKDVVERDTKGKTQHSPKGDDMKPQGAQQAFVVDDNKLGYVQEIAIPWALITGDGQPRAAGATLVLTAEPNFTAGPTNGRLSIKDIFRPGLQIDRVFTFQNRKIWGEAPLLAKGQVALRPTRLSDGREFPVMLKNGALQVDWSGLEDTVDLGFKPVTVKLPADGFASLQIVNPAGLVVRNLYTAEPLSAGAHTVKWDGLGDGYALQPGPALPAGAYTWRAIWHTGIGVKLRGWALNEGRAPWDGTDPGDNWGGDMGPPSSVATDGDFMYLGWGGSEAGKALVVTDLDGQAEWRHKRGGFGGAGQVAVAGGMVYVFDGQDNSLYAVDAKTHMYLPWPGTTSTAVPVATLWGAGAPAGAPAAPSGLAAQPGRLYLAANVQPVVPPAPKPAKPGDPIPAVVPPTAEDYAKAAAAGFIAVVDTATGKPLQRLAVPAPGALCLRDPDTLCVVSGGTQVLAVTLATGATKVLVDGLTAASGLAVAPDGTLYVGTGAPDHQVLVFNGEGKPLRHIGRAGGRQETGFWQADGLRNINGLALDTRAHLWVAESTLYPRRFSVWDAASGKLVRELFGPTHYGASGAAIHPKDPNVMVGEGCEWHLDPKTGRATCVGVFDVHGGGFLGGHSFARFITGRNGRDYLAVANLSAPGAPDLGQLASIVIYGRQSPGTYVVRSRITTSQKAKATRFWADVNDDQQEQEDEVTTVPSPLVLGGYYYWSMHLNTDFTLYGRGTPLAVTGFTPCGAPKYDTSVFDPARALPMGLPSLDNRLLLTGYDATGRDTGWYQCLDVASGKLLWQYPNAWMGVHGSHNAPPPARGLLRGVFGPIGCAKVPTAGYVWALNTNVGEWHLLTQDGYYLSRLFQPDGLKVAFPLAARPGTMINDVPSGMGGEDFGGSLVQGEDGKVYLEAGKVATWNCEVTGLDSIKPLGTGALPFSAEDAAHAERVREALLQRLQGVKRLSVMTASPTFTGDFKADFKGAEVASYKKQDDGAVRTALAWDAKTLYVAWEVADQTPWANGATETPMLYLGGDTVDLQLGTDPKAPKDRAEPVAGDLRLSIGNFQGQPTAVLYRKVLPAGVTAQPWAVSSGVVKDYRHEFVGVLADAVLKVTVRPGAGYLVEAAIPLATLGLTPAAGQVLRGDVGVTHGDPAGQRTRLRTYWSNQATGIVDDAVFELKLEPKNWGELLFK